MSNKQIYEALNIAREEVFNEIGTIISSRSEGEAFTLGKLQGLMTAFVMLQDMLKAVNSMGTIDDWDELRARLEETARATYTKKAGAFTSDGRTK